MLTFKQLDEKKTKVKVNPKIDDLKETESYDLTEEWVNASVEISADYFFAEGINEDGLDQIINEVGLEDFVEFVVDPIEELNEERAARKAKSNAPSYEKVKAAVDKSDKAKKKTGKGEYSKSYAKRSGETEDSTNYNDKAPAKKKKVVAKATTRKPAAPKKKAATKAKVEKAVKTAKKTQPVKPTSKKGLLGKVGDAVKKGMERHNKARAAGREPEKRVKEFAKGFKKGVTGTVKFAGKVKKAVSEESEHVDEKISASGYARAKKYREDQARAKDKKEQEYYANKAKTHKWDGEKWNKKEKVSEENVEEGLKQARKNIGMDPDKPSCWDGYKAKGTKKKGGKEVPNCVKEDEVMEGLMNNLKKAVNKKLASAGRNFKGGSVSQTGNYAEKSLKSEEVEDVEEGYKSYEKGGEVKSKKVSLLAKLLKKKKDEKKPEKAMDAGSRAKRLLARKVHAKYVSGSTENVPDNIRDSVEVEGEELKEYSPNVSYQAKGGKKSGKLGKSSVYSLRDKDESKKEFRKSHTKDIKDGLLKKEEAEYVDEAGVVAALKPLAKAAAVGAAQQAGANAVTPKKKKKEEDGERKDPDVATESVVREAKVDQKLPDYKRATARDKRYGNPHGSHELGGGIRKDRRDDHEKRRGVKEEVVDEAKVDAGKSPETKEKDRNVRKFGVSHSVAAHGKLRRALHRSDRGDKKIKGDKSKYVEMEQVIHSTSSDDTYASQEKISEKRSEEIRTENILTFKEATRLKKEKGYDKGGTKKPGKKPTALSVVLDKIKKEHGAGAVMGQGGSKQKKKEKGAKSSSGTGKYLKKAQDKKAYAAKAKKAGFKSTQSYTDTVARYGGESNYKKGRGLGT